MSSAIVSIIVPCYKQAHYLSDALDSVLAQTYSNWECIIVNDGSPDQTDEVVKPYLIKDSRFKYIKQANNGLPAARNTGIRNSCGLYILPLDGDDIIEPTYLEKAINWFENHPETKLVYCRARLFGSINSSWNLDDYDYDKFIWCNCIFCSSVYKREDYDKTNGYNTNMVHGFEDWDFWLSLLSKNDIVHRLDDVLFSYRIKKESMSTSLNQNHLDQMYIQLYRNHPDIYEPYCNRLFLYNQLNEENRDLRKEIKNLQASRAYRLGKLLLRPLKWFKKSLL